MTCSVSVMEMKGHWISLFLVVADCRIMAPSCYFESLWLLQTKVCQLLLTLSSAGSKTCLSLSKSSSGLLPSVCAIPPAPRFPCSSLRTSIHSAYTKACQSKDPPCSPHASGSRVVVLLIITPLSLLTWPRTLRFQTSAFLFPWIHQPLRAEPRCWWDVWFLKPFLTHHCKVALYVSLNPLDMVWQGRRMQEWEGIPSVSSFASLNLV